jgi:cellulose synthase/poly-beta-1,6-N-acetylglucosamine synthase-like glycosyltransferase
MISHLLAIAALVQCAINYFALRIVRPDGEATIKESVAILIPMRNESANVEGVIDSTLNQTGLKNSQIFVLEDNSTDETAQLMKKYQSEIVIDSGNRLPAGWLGKNFALHQLTSLPATHSAEYLVFLDADIRLEPEAVSSAITLMNTLKWDFLSPYPREIAESFAERLIQPLLQWSWLASVPLRRAERGKRKSMVIANGQFFIVKRSAYDAIGGHQSIKSEVLDDLQLARTLVGAGFIGGVADGSAVAHCRMYTTATELINGYTKSLWKAFGGPVGALATAAILFLIGPWPLIQLIQGDGYAILYFGAIIASRAITARRVHTPLWEAILHPLGITFLLYLMTLSWIRKSRGTLTWKGRTLA